jgi:hypothetical protein
MEATMGSGEGWQDLTNLFDLDELNYSVGLEDEADELEDGLSVRTIDELLSDI